MTGDTAAGALHVFEQPALDKGCEASQAAAAWSSLEAPTSAGAQIFLFSRRTNFRRPGERFLGKSPVGASKVMNLALALGSLWAMAGDSRPEDKGLSPRPLPLIGGRRVIMQYRAHDDVRAAPAVAPAVAVGPEIPMASAFQSPTPE